MQQIRAEITATGANTTGIIVPPGIVEALGAGKRPRVKVTIGNYSYRSSIASMGGVYMISVSAEVRAGAGASAGDVVDVGIELDTEPREVEVPPALAAALEADADARTFFDGLSYSNKRRLVTPIVDAKTEETRQRRIAKTVKGLRTGKV
jgi:hypothetical protein